MSLNWYDGTTSGLAQCSRCSAVFRYDIVVWDSDQEHRIFVLSPIEAKEFDDLVELLSGFETPKWPFWSSRWWASPTDQERIQSEIEIHVKRAGTPQFVIASDRELDTVYAAKELSRSGLLRLPTVFDGLPVSDEYFFWTEYIGL